MSNYNQAPILEFDVPKDKGNNYYELPQKLMDKIFADLGNSSAQIRIMIVLVGTKPGFAVSEKWICDRTGLKDASYKNARKELVKRGWLSHESSKSIKVNFKKILGEDEKTRGNMVYPQCSNMVYPHEGNVVLPIIDKEINNKIDNKGVMNQPQAADCITLVNDSRSKVDVLKDVINNSTSNQGNFKF